MRYTLLIFLSLFACCTSAHNVSDTTEVAANGNLVALTEEENRPLYHFTPPLHWMNDPNGLVYYKGTYHLFYQHNPAASVWGPMYWGHATSTDLFNWSDKAIAITPDSMGTIFSGSAVVDENNTSGFKNGEDTPLVAIYTIDGKQQHQAIAYSTNAGNNWVKFSGNPVLPNPGVPDFRDPKVSWNGTVNKWIMVMAAGQKVNFYSSPDLKHWTYESSFGEGIGAHGGVWECPDIFQLPVEGTKQKKWVLFVSINPGGPNGGSATQYFAGDFDGHKFSNESSETKWIDYGTDNYASVSYNNIPAADGRRIIVGWMSNWKYAEKVPTTQWRSTYTVPRELSLVANGSSIELKSVPVRELSAYQTQAFDAPAAVKTITISDHATIKSGSYALNFIADFSKTNNVSCTLGNSLEKFVITVDKLNKQIVIDRSNAGNGDFNPMFKNKIYCPFIPKDGDNIFKILIDKTSAEVFVNNGERVVTSLFFPKYQYNKITITSEADGSVKQVNVQAIKKSFR